MPAHRKKYDEGIHCIVSHPNENLLASCGADSIIKIISVPHLDNEGNDLDVSYQHSLL